MKKAWKKIQFWSVFRSEIVGVMRIFCLLTAMIDDKKNFPFDIWRENLIIYINKN